MSARLSLSITLLAALLALSGCQREAEFEFEIESLSDRVITIAGLTGNSRAMAVNSEDGIMLIDTFWSPSIAEEAKAVIGRLFGRDEFSYVVNTSSDDMVSRGNSAFPGATIIAHEDCRRSLEAAVENLESELARRADEFGERIDRSEGQLAEKEPGSEEAVFLQNWIDLCRRIEEDMRRGYDVVLPEVTFDDSMSVDLGGIRVELVYFGATGNIGDIFVIVPGEGVAFLGDVFHGGHVLPSTGGAIGDVDPGRWLESLDYLLGHPGNIEHFVRANGGAYTRERLRQARDLLAGVLVQIGLADAAGMGLDDLLAEFAPVEDKFPFVRAWDVYARYGSSIITQDIKSLAVYMWRRTHESAASMIAGVMEEDGIDEARRAFRELMSAGGNEYYFSEAELNNKGYAFLGRDMVAEAVAMFQFAVEIYPHSSNVYDSLGEGYMRAGSTDLAIENYRKSLELDPDNTNAARMLEELQQI